MRDFHRSFLPELVLVSLVTIVCMISVKVFFHNHNLTTIKTPEYTTHKSQISVDVEKIKSIRPSSH